MAIELLGWWMMDMMECSQSLNREALLKILRAGGGKECEVGMFGMWPIIRNKRKMGKTQV